MPSSGRTGTGHRLNRTGGPVRTYRVGPFLEFLARPQATRCCRLGWTQQRWWPRERGSVGFVHRSAQLDTRASDLWQTRPELGALRGHAFCGWGEFPAWARALSCVGFEAPSVQLQTLRGGKGENRMMLYLGL